MVTSLDEVDDDEQDDDNRSDPSDLETIQSQAQTIQAYLSEINYLKQKLHHTETVTSLAVSLRVAKQIAEQKKSARVSLVKLLTAVYQTEIDDEFLK
jgi:hypothetical protein